MAEDATPRDADRLENVAHPRETERVIGHGAALAAFDQAISAGRLHHAWLLTGPRGIGKATVAYQLARRLLIGAAKDGAIQEAQLRAGAHPRFLEIRRAWNAKTGKFRGETVIDDVRRLTRFFGLSAADGGWRVALIDPAEDLNVQAANALLKALEEPPKRTIFLITSHAVGRLPATILSRCRRLKFQALSEPETVEAMRAAQSDIEPSDARALARLSDGAPGEALRLLAIGGLETWRTLIELHHGLPRFDRIALDAVMGSAAGRAGAERFELLVRLWPMLIERLAVAGARRAGAASDPATAPEMAALAEKLAPDAAAARLWAEASSDIRDRLEAARGLNLDPERAILDTALTLEDWASKAIAR